MRLHNAVLFLFLSLWHHISAQETGRVSYYSHKLIGKKMTNGEKYNACDFVAAHRNYPLGTLLKVTNLDNGKFVVVKVTDRGPFSHTRVIDISYAAAEKIGMISSGHANVKVEEANELQFLLTPETMLTEQTPKLKLACEIPFNVKLFP
ncbi:MAG: septal ring lytic transglycosylase RlpA family protein [Bacteroidota bacterium]|nr:septal ring lytic transglycosylase RlpA family protein [Bacteroidota bacterium]